MKPVEFTGMNITIAKDQPEYQPLPAAVTPDGLVISCWKLTLVERIKVLFFGRVWLQQLTFDRPLQPQLPSIECPFVIQNSDDSVKDDS